MTTKLTAGYEAGHYYLKPSPNTKLSTLAPLLAHGYRLRLDLHGVLLKRRD